MDLLRLDGLIPLCQVLQRLYGSLEVIYSDELDAKEFAAWPSERTCLQWGKGCCLAGDKMTPGCQKLAWCWLFSTSGHLFGLRIKQMACKWLWMRSLKCSHEISLIPGRSWEREASFILLPRLTEDKQNTFPTLTEASRSQRPCRERWISWAGWTWAAWPKWEATNKGRRR